MFRVVLACYLGLNSGRSVSINVNKTRKHYFRNIHGAHLFPQCLPVSHAGNIVSSVRFCFQDSNYAYATQQGILTKIRACEHLQKFCDHEQASTHLIFASNSSKGQILKFCEHFPIEWDHSTPLIWLMMMMMFKTLKHVPKTEKRCSVFKHNICLSIFD